MVKPLQKKLNNQPNQEPLYLFMGGLPTHPCRGLPCTIGWEFETSNNVMVYFEHDPRSLSNSVIESAKKLGLKWADNNLGFEICDKDELIPID
jgi:hypothetical protein